MLRFDAKLPMVVALLASLGACKGKLTRQNDNWALHAEEIPGAPHDVDPVAILPLVTTQVKKRLDSKEPELLSIRMVGVGASGHMDVGGCDSSINYRFAVHQGSERTAGAVTIGAGGMYLPVYEATSNIKNGGIAVAAPHCKVETVRAAAVAAGVHDDACTLQLEYTRVVDPEIDWFRGTGWRTFGPGGPIVIDDATCEVVPKP